MTDIFAGPQPADVERDIRSRNYSETTLTGDCVNCHHPGSKHKGIDPNKRVKSRCTGTLERGQRCDCNCYETAEFKREREKAESDGL